MSNDQIKVLFLAADPFQNNARLQIDRVMRGIFGPIDQGKARRALEIIPGFVTRVSGLQRALLRHQPQIVHFSASGDQPGVIRLADEHGRPHTLDKQALSKLFGAPAGTTRMVVLNGCETVPVVEALGGVVDYVVGIGPLSDDASIAFAEMFYLGLASGRGVITAFDLAKVQVQMHSPSEAAVPMLRVRAGADPHAAMIEELMTERSTSERMEHRARSALEGYNVRLREERVDHGLSAANDAPNFSLTGNETLEGYRPRPKPKPKLGND
jgi:hypothetical protein